MKAKKIVALLLAVMMVFAFTACSNNQGNDGGTASGDKPYIAVVSKGFQHQFWQVVHKGAQAAADQYGVDITFEGPPSESDIGPQVDMLKSALAKNPSAICLAALDTDAVIEQLNQAKTKNIPVTSDLILGFPTHRKERLQQTLLQITTKQQRSPQSNYLHHLNSSLLWKKEQKQILSGSPFCL